MPSAPPDPFAAGPTDALACEVRCIDPGAIRTARRALVAPEVERLAALFGALGDPTRFRLITALLTGPLCTCDLAAVLAVSASAVSHQLRLLKDAGLVTSRREGRVVYHAIAGEHVRRFVGEARRQAQPLLAA